MNKWIWFSKYLYYFRKWTNAKEKISSITEKMLKKWKNVLRIYHKQIFPYVYILQKITHLFYVKRIHILKRSFSYTILYYTALYYIILYYIILYYTILYCTILYYIYYTILYYATVHYKRHIENPVKYLGWRFFCEIS